MVFCTTEPERKLAKSWLYPQDNGDNANKYFDNEAGKRSKEIRFDTSFFKKLASLDPLNGCHDFCVNVNCCYCFSIMFMLVSCAIDCM